MQIDEQVEEHVRDAFGASIDRDSERMRSALDGMNSEQLRDALSLAYFAVGYVMNDVYDGDPSSADIADVAKRVVRSEQDWIDLNESEVSGLLAAASKGAAEVSGVKPGDALGLTIVTGAALLAGFRRAKENENWDDYLDEVWEALLAAPDPSQG